MVEIRSIVAATDLSAPARRAIDRAASLAQAAPASLALVHAVNAPVFYELRRWLDTGGEIERSIVDELRARFHDLPARSPLATRSTSRSMQSPAALSTQSPGWPTSGTRISSSPGPSVPGSSATTWWVRQPSA